MTLDVVLASLTIIVGGALVVGALMVGRSPRSRKRSVTPPSTTEVISDADLATPSVHDSWSPSDPSPIANPAERAVTERRAQILTGIQLVLGITLLISGFYLAKTVGADQLIRFIR